jgi:hypothetical protein
MIGDWPTRETQPYHWVSHAVVLDNWKLLTKTPFSAIEFSVEQAR